MVGRSQLRAKTLEVLYANEINPLEEKQLLKNLLKNIVEIEDLYLSKLSILVAIKDASVIKNEFQNKKRINNDTLISPNKIAFNRHFLIISQNNILNQHLEKKSHLRWNHDDPEIMKIFKDILKSNLYKDYQSSQNSFNNDKKFALKIFEEFVAGNSVFDDQFEENKISWADGSVANTMVISTIESLTQKSDENITLYKVLNKKTDEIFINQLVKTVCSNSINIDNYIKNHSQNWDFERISIIDKVILRMAIAEILYFHDIPNKVSINEYLELSKDYSSEKSKLFINGILDRIAKQSEIEL